VAAFARSALASLICGLAVAMPGHGALDSDFPLLSGLEASYAARYVRRSDYFDEAGVRSKPGLKQAWTEHVFGIKLGWMRLISLESELPYLAFRHEEDANGLDRPSVGMKITVPGSTLALTADLHFPTGDSSVVGKYPTFSQRYGAMLHTGVGTAVLTAGASYAFHAWGEEPRWASNDVVYRVSLSTPVTPEIAIRGGLERMHFYNIEGPTDRIQGTAGDLTHFTAALRVRTGGMIEWEFFQELPYMGMNFYRSWTTGIQARILMGRRAPLFE
jgi:hypothetical protein